jgi:hypothetical protein
MPSKHKIAFFVCKDGVCPVEDYIFDGRNETDYDLIIGAMQHLAHVGSAIFDTNMAKQFNDHKPLCELRKNRHRIFFAEDKTLNRYVMLAAFIKKTQKTPPEELAQAEKYWQEYLTHRQATEFDIPLDFNLINL